MDKNVQSDKRDDEMLEKEILENIKELFYSIKTEKIQLEGQRENAKSDTMNELLGAIVGVLDEILVLSAENREYIEKISNSNNQALNDNIIEHNKHHYTWELPVFNVNLDEAKCIGLTVEQVEQYKEKEERHNFVLKKEQEALQEDFERYCRDSKKFDHIQKITNLTTLWMELSNVQYGLFIHDYGKRKNIEKQLKTFISRMAAVVPAYSKCKETYEIIHDVARLIDAYDRKKLQQSFFNDFDFKAFILDTQKNIFSNVLEGQRITNMHLKESYAFTEKIHCEHKKFAFFGEGTDEFSLNEEKINELIKKHGVLSSI